MNDDELIMALREQRGKVSMTTPVEQIITRGRAVRARRRVPRAASGSGARLSGPGAKLASWTVARQADGTIQVTFFRELRDPAGLQRTLRADGVPASVTFIGQQNPACQPYSSPPGNSPPRLPRPFGGPLNGVLGSPFHNPPQDAMVIHPAALPSGAGLQIAVMRGIPLGPAGPWPYPKGSGHPVVEVGLVKASPRCTGG